jgi:hypothetical protein
VNASDVRFGGHLRRFKLRPATSGLPLSTDVLGIGQKVSNGRVEDGRGGLGPEAITPFPIPAHRTGHADFRHPALRPVSSRGIRRGSPWQAFETQQAAFSVDNFKREPPCSAPCHLVPSGKEVSYAFIDIVVDSPVARTQRSEAEVVRPSDLFSVSRTSSHGSMLLGASSRRT